MGDKNRRNTEFNEKLTSTINNLVKSKNIKVIMMYNWEMELIMQDSVFSSPPFNSRYIAISQYLI